jgi:hypothetical protein
MALAIISRLSMGTDLIGMTRNSPISNLLRPPGCLTYSSFVCDIVQSLVPATKMFPTVKANSSHRLQQNPLPSSIATPTVNETAEYLDEGAHEERTASFRRNVSFRNLFYYLFIQHQ